MVDYEMELGRGVDPSDENLQILDLLRLAPLLPPISFICL